MTPSARAQAAIEQAGGGWASGGGGEESAAAAGSFGEPGRSELVRATLAALRRDGYMIEAVPL
jgi:hypothetical protein